MNEVDPVPDRRWSAFAILAMAQFVVILDISVVNIALPSMKAPLGFSQGGLQWVVDAYMLTFGGFLLLGGRAADILGRKKVFLTGLVIFGLSSLACGFAQTSGELIAARAVQGLGGAIMSPAALSLAIVMFPQDHERNRAMALWSAVAAAGGAAGVVLGGVLTNAFGWSWVFWINAPLTLGGALLGTRLIAETARAEGSRSFDLLGAVSATAGLSALIYGLVQIGESGWGSRPATALSAAVVLLALFVAVERRAAAPIVEFSIFRVRVLSAANLIMLLFAAGAVAMTFFVTIYLQQVLHYGPIQAGLCFLPIAVGQVLVSQVASRLLGRLGLRNLLLIGLAFSAASFLWFSRISTDGSFLKSILGPGLLLAVGSGFAFTALVISSVSGVEPHQSGLAGGLINMSQQIGGALGLAVLASAATWRTNNIAGHGPVNGSALVEGYRLGFLVGAALIVVGAVVGAAAMRTATTTAPEPVGESPLVPSQEALTQQS